MATTTKHEKKTPYLLFPGPGVKNERFDRRPNLLRASAIGVNKKGVLHQKVRPVSQINPQTSIATLSV